MPRLAGQLERRTFQLSASRPATTTMASQVRGSSRPTVATSWKIAWPDGLIIIQR